VPGVLSRWPGFTALVIARGVSVVGDGIGAVPSCFTVQAEEGAGPQIDATSVRTVLLTSAGAGLLTAVHLAGSRPPRWPSRTSPGD